MLHSNTSSAGRERRRRYGEAERFGRDQVDDQIALGRGLTRFFDAWRLECRDQSVAAFCMAFLQQRQNFHPPLLVADP
jgi:hypothetical protein